MFPSAPDVQVYAPTTLFAGEQVSVEINVTAVEATKIEYVDTRITGIQGWRISSGEHAVFEQVRWPELHARLHEAGQLPAGVSRFRTSFALPREMPPSHDMTPAWAYLELFVRVAIPWWPDGKYYFRLPVRVRPPVTLERTPYAIRSTAAAGAPRIELSLASTRLCAGETVVGSLAIYQLDDRKPREVEITLVPSFKLVRRGRYRERRGPTLGVTVTVPAGAAGTSVPFTFRLPADMTPTFSTITHSLAWWLVARTGSLFGKKLDVSMPLEIHDASAMATVERLRAAPRLTDERINAAFAHFAQEQGWREIAADQRSPTELEQIQYERTAGDATLRLGYVYRGEEGAFLLASVAPPSLGMGLVVTPTSRLRDLLSRDVEVGITEFDRGNHVLARWPEQAQAFLRAAVPAAQAATEALGSLLRWDDDDIVFERQVSAVELGDLARASAALAVLAAALAAAPIPQPPGIEIDRDAWRALAQRLTGSLRLGDLAIEGTLDEQPVEILIGWFDGTAEQVTVSVGELDHGLATTVDAVDLGADITGVRIANGVATATLTVHGGRVDVARVKQLVFDLRGVIEKLRRPDGPYR